MPQLSVATHANLPQFIPIARATLSDYQRVTTALASRQRVTTTLTDRKRVTVTLRDYLPPEE